MNRDKRIQIKIKYKAFVHRKIFHKWAGFSLVEMLMTLLVASLLLVAMAPVVTKRVGDSLLVEGSVPFEKIKRHEISYGSDECSDIKTDTDGSEYCEGSFKVPIGINGTMKVTVIGGGGGGAAASTAGYTEYTTVGNSNIFTVPVSINKIEATLVGGGGAGGPGGKEINVWEKLGGGQTNWNIPNEVKNTYIVVRTCGAGGGKGISDASGTAGGGSGAYISKLVLLPSISSIPIIVGGRGGAGDGVGISGYNYGGGAGGGSAGVGGKGNNVGGDGGQGNDIGGGAFSIPTEGKGASDGGGNGQCTSQTAGIPIGGGGSGGKGGIFSRPGSYICSGGGGGAIGGGGGAGGGYGGAGGGGGASTFGVPGQSYYIIASGGGGGAGYAASGGGGGGPAGGNGGFVWDEGTNYNNLFAGGYGATCNTGGCTTGYNGDGNWTGSAYRWGNPGPSPTNEFDSNYCAGEKDGAIRIFYAANRSGGVGGGGAAVVPYQSVKVNPDESLNIKIAKNSEGGISGGYNADTSFNVGNYGDIGDYSSLYRSSSQLLSTTLGHLTHRGNPYGASSPSGVTISAIGTDGRAGSVFDGISNAYYNNFNGASNSSGLGANDAPFGSTNIGAVNSNGGRGGMVYIFNKQLCTPGLGGTAVSPTGGNATGYGCGGGGGSRGANGGNGSSGYARISWNKYWNITTNKYDLVKNGSGGGGASGNVLKYTLNVRSGDIIKIRIGKGGNGGYVSSNIFVEAQSGGTTIFGLGTSQMIKAGGGKGGFTPKLSGTFPNTNILNGTGGTTSNVCYMNTLNLFDDNRYCTKGESGKNASETKGGDGASQSIYGTGGTSRSAGVGTTDGLDGDGVGSGGAGAALRDIGNVSPIDSTGNPTKGGAGRAGKILIEWKE